MQIKDNRKRAKQVILAYYVVKEVYTILSDSVLQYLHEIACMSVCVCVSNALKCKHEA